MRVVYILLFLAVFFGPYLYVWHPAIHWVRIVPALVLFLGAFANVRLGRKQRSWLLFLSIYFIYTLLVSFSQLDQLRTNDLLNFIGLYVLLIALVFANEMNKKLFYSTLPVVLIGFLAACGFVWVRELRTNIHLAYSGMAEFTPDHYYHLPTTFFTNANDFAAVLVLSAMYLHFLVRRNDLPGFINWMLHAFVFAVIYTTDSKLAFLIYVFYCLYFYFHVLWRAKALVIVALVVMVVALAGDDLLTRSPGDFDLLKFDLDESSSLLRRYNLYKFGLLSVTENYGFGLGIGGYHEYYSTKIGSAVLFGDMDPHNYFIEILMNSGLYIFLLMVTVHGYILYDMIKTRREGGIVIQYILYHFLLLASSSSLFLWPHYLFFITYVFTDKSDGEST